jgi:hypothetical protein
MVRIVKTAAFSIPAGPGGEKTGSVTKKRLPGRGKYRDRRIIDVNG